MDKEDVVEYYLAMRKKEILPFMTMWLDCEGIMLSEIRQTEKNNLARGFSLSFIQKTIFWIS